jgi:hypothetical protein
LHLSVFPSSFVSSLIYCLSFLALFCLFLSLHTWLCFKSRFHVSSSIKPHHTARLLRRTEI